MIELLPEITAMVGNSDILVGAYTSAGAMLATSPGADDHRMRMNDMGILPQLPTIGHSPNPTESLSDTTADLYRQERALVIPIDLRNVYACRSFVGHLRPTHKTLWIQRLSTKNNECRSVGHFCVSSSRCAA